MVPNGVRQLEVELPAINYESLPLPADISSRRDSHKFRVFCRGVDGFKHDVCIFKPSSQRTLVIISTINLSTKYFSILYKVLSFVQCAESVILNPSMMQKM
jgi:hypothetical protein